MAPDPTPIVLADDSLHVWTASVSQKSVAPTDEALAVLSADELARARRFRRLEDRLLFTQAHIAVRRTLSRYAPIPPQAWSFEPGENGRPEIRNLDAPEGLRFNLSHTPGMVAIVVNASFDAGVDVECIGRVTDLAAMARTSFSSAERASLLALPTAERPRRFTQTWALKESFVKAMGTGLTAPLRSFSFDLSSPTLIRFDCAPHVDRDPSAWSFSVSEPTDNHVLATASRLGSGKGPTVAHFPLCWERSSPLARSAGDVNR